MFQTDSFPFNLFFLKRWISRPDKENSSPWSMSCFIIPRYDIIILGRLVLDENYFPRSNDRLKVWILYHPRPRPALATSDQDSKESFLLVCLCLCSEHVIRRRSHCDIICMIIALQTPSCIQMNGCNRMNKYVFFWQKALSTSSSPYLLRTLAHGSLANNAMMTLVPAKSEWLSLAKCSPDPHVIISRPQRPLFTNVDCVFQMRRQVSSGGRHDRRKIKMRNFVTLGWRKYLGIWLVTKEVRSVDPLRS